MLFNGRGTPRDEAEAVRFITMAAERGFPQAQLNLGKLNAPGRGVPKDDTMASVWFRLAAEKGVRDAQLRMADLYREGRGVRRDEIDAQRWLDRANRSASAASPAAPDHGPSGVPRPDLSSPLGNPLP